MTNMNSERPLKFKVRKLGIPSHFVEGQLIVRNPNFVPKKGAKVVLKGEKGQILIGITDHPFGRVDAPYIPVNVIEGIDKALLEKAMKKNLFAEKFVKFKPKRRK